MKPGKLNMVLTGLDNYNALGGNAAFLAGFGGLYSSKEFAVARL